MIISWRSCAKLRNYEFMSSNLFEAFGLFITNGCVQFCFSKRRPRYRDTWSLSDECGVKEHHFVSVLHCQWYRNLLRIERWNSNRNLLAWNITIRNYGLFIEWEYKELLGEKFYFIYHSRKFFQVVNCDLEFLFERSFSYAIELHW